jgi:hypothetical protein
VLGNWELNQNAMNRRIIIQTGYLFDKFSFADSSRVMEKFAIDACL